MRNDFDPKSATTAEDSGGHRRAVTARKTTEDSAGEIGATLGLRTTGNETLFFP